MKAKTILSITAFFTAFAVSAALASLFIPAITTADAISALVRQDVRNGNERDRTIRRLGIDVNASFYHPKFSDYAEIVENYVEASDTLNASDLPPDFRYAWRRHMDAWRDYSMFLNNVNNSDRWGNTSVREFERIEINYIREINQTWYEVLRIARNHGSNVRGY